jgi:hypothetical protein
MRLVADLTLDKHMLAEALRKKSEALTPQRAGQVVHGVVSHHLPSGVPAGAFQPSGWYQWGRHSPMLEVGASLSGQALAGARSIDANYGTTPRSITVDHGREFTSGALEDWAYARGVQIDFIHPGNPWKTRLSKGSTAACATSV